MKGKIFKKGFALGLVITMLGMQCVVMESKPVQAAGNRKSINLGTSVLSTDGYTDGYWTEEEGIKVYLGQAKLAYGGNNGTEYEPMPYRVLNSDGNTSAFLDGDAVIAAQNISASGTSWSGSPSGAWLENTFYGGSSNFSPLEKSLIMSTNLAEETYSQTMQNREYSLKDEAASLHVFSISAKEAVTYYQTAAIRDKSGAHHWLRTAVTTGDKRASVYTGGALDAYDAGNPYVRMCPAMNITLNNVAFTKAYSYTNGNFSAVSDAGATSEITEEELYDFTVNPKGNISGYTIEGATVQEYVSEIDDITVTAEEGYYFPKNYAEQIYYRTWDMEVPEQATDLKEYGITVTRISGSKIHIAGTLTESLHLFLPDASKKEIVELSFAPYELSYEMGTSVQIFKAITAMKNADTEVVVPSNAVRYASSDTTVADVDSITGEITLKKAGTFRITATLAEGEDYLGTSIESEIITVMPEVIPPVFVMPETQYERKAELGKNSYYISPLTLLAPEGYYISTDSTKNFGESVTFLTSSNQAVVYLKDVTTGLVSEAIEVPAFKIDSSAPVIPEIKNESTIYGSSIVLNVQDENLVKLVINGEEQELTGEITKIELSANYGIEKYEILAIDEAGNETTLTFTLAEEWMKSAIIPASRIVYLRTGQPYRLGAGTWTVGGDTTEYSGGITFYIRKEEQYIFQSR